MVKGLSKKSVLIFQITLLQILIFPVIQSLNRAFPSGRCSCDGIGKFVFLGFASSSHWFCKKSPLASWMKVFFTKNLHTQTLLF